MCIGDFILNPPTWFQSLEILLAVLAMMGIGRLIKWPNREKWIAEFKHNSYTISSLNLQRTLSKDRRLSWISSEPQSVGDIYKIDLGKGRVICEVKFEPIKIRAIQVVIKEPMMKEMAHLIIGGLRTFILVKPNSFIVA